jgi:hypothetical protein
LEKAEGCERLSNMETDPRTTVVKDDCSVATSSPHSQVFVLPQQGTSEVLVEEPVRAILREVLSLGGDWARWAKAGCGGRSLQRVVEWGERCERFQRILVAPRTRRVLEEGIKFADRKLDQLQRTTIGRPVFVLFGTAAKRVEPFLRPRIPSEGSEERQTCRTRQQLRPQRSACRASFPARSFDTGVDTDGLCRFRIGDLAAL